jgi:putative spermidine/putrescine transport system permease protein
MHSSEVSKFWGESREKSFGWRVLDIAIRAREASSRALPDRSGYFGLFPAIVLMGTLVGGLLVLAWGSFHEYDTYLAKSGNLSVVQYVEVILDPQFQSTLGRTVSMALVTSSLTVAVGVAYAFAIVRSPRWVRLILLISMFVPLLTGDVTRTFGLVVALGTGGPIDWAMESSGLGSAQLLGTLPAIGIGMFQTLLPVAVVILLPAVLRLDPELVSAAASMGARALTVFFEIILPQLKLGALAALATCFALAMGAFADPAILGRGLLDFTSNFLQARYLAQGNPAQGGAIGILLILIVSAGSAVLLGLGRIRRRSHR